MNTSWLDALAAWLGTFALHSTLVLVVALIGSRLLGRRALGSQEAALRLLPWLALASATLQCVAFGSPWSPLPTSDVVAVESVDAPAWLPTVVPDAVPATVPVLASSWRWQQIVVFVAAASAALGVVWLATVALRLRALLRDREPEADPRVLSLAATAAHAAGLRQSPHVSRSARVATPIAFGSLRPEICLPANAASLEAPSLRAMLAHEVAHLRAADPAWMWGAAWLQALFPWQLLLFPVRARWARIVELRCDAEAARHAGSTAVARCLLDVASWLQPRSQAPLVALGMASRPSALRERVDAALRGDPFAPPSVRRASAAASVVLGSLTFAAPGAMPSEPPLFELVADASAALSMPSSTPFGELLNTLDRERRLLVGEAEQLRARLAVRTLSPELRVMQVALTTRLREIERLHARLQAYVGRTSPLSR